MDRKTLAIGAMVVVAMLLGGLVANSLYQERAAYGQGGVYATYLGASVLVRDGYGSFAILDTDTRLMIFYEVDITKFDLKPTAAKHLNREFQRTAP
jgi:uncharacterized membrane protein